MRLLISSNLSTCFGLWNEFPCAEPWCNIASFYSHEPVIQRLYVEITSHSHSIPFLSCVCICVACICIHVYPMFVLCVSNYMCVCTSTLHVYARVYACATVYYLSRVASEMFSHRSSLRRDRRPCSTSAWVWVLHGTWHWCDWRRKEEP